MSKRQKIDIFLVKLSDWFLQKTLRGKWKRSSNQRMRTWYFKKYYGYLIKKYASIPIPQENNHGPIWFFWWQGEDTMPPIVKKCYALAQEHAPVGHPVVLITENNFSQYTDIPTYIIEKVRNKTITLTHFSDILRVSLLRDNGGLWMDATLYTSGLIEEKIFNQSFFSVRTPDDGQWVSKCLWTGFFMGAPKGHPLYSFMCDLFYEYWRTHDELLDYFLIDLGIRMAYDNIPQIKKSIDEGVWFTDKLFVPEKNIAKPFDKELYTAITSEWSFYKMTYRDYFGKLMITNDEGQETWYGHMLTN